MIDPSLAGRLVKDVVLEMMSEHEGISDEEIAEKLGISRGLVLTICNELIRDGHVSKGTAK